MAAGALVEGLKIVAPPTRVVPPTSSANALSFSLSLSLSLSLSRGWALAESRAARAKGSGASSDEEVDEVDGARGLRPGPGSDLPFQ